MAISDYLNPYNYPEKQADRTARVIFKCLNCKHVWSQEFPKKHYGWDMKLATGGDFFYAPVWKVYGYYPQRSICPECQSNRVKSDMVKGKVNDTPCDHRCTHAKGHSCECSCGGENHGRAYQAK